MGRGDQHKERSHASHMLFGPRRPKPISPQRQQQIEAAKRARALAAKEKQHVTALRQAEAELLQGQAQPLLDFLAQPRVAETDKAEQEELKELCFRLRQHFRAIPPPSLPNDALATLEALQRLRQRIVLRHLSDFYQGVMQTAAMAYTGQLVGAELDRRLEQSADEIGPLPRVWTSAQLRGYHLRQPGGQRLLCDKDFVAHSDIISAAVARGEATPLSDPITCSECWSRYRAGAAADSYEPDQWLAVWRQHQDERVRQHRDGVEQAFGPAGPAPVLEANSIWRTALHSALARQREILERCNIPIPAALERPSD